VAQQPPPLHELRKARVLLVGDRRELLRASSTRAPLDRLGCSRAPRVVFGQDETCGTPIASRGHPAFSTSMTMVIVVVVMMIVVIVVVLMVIFVTVADVDHVPMIVAGTGSEAAHHYR